MTGASGTVVGEQRYYPFGETRGATGSMLTDKLFTGQREMEGLGIYHYGARFYSPTLGKFLSADTIVPGYANPQTLNRYSYVANNPLKYADPTGHKCLPDDGCETPHGDIPGPVTNKNNHNDNNDDGGGSDWCTMYPWACGGATPEDLVVQLPSLNEPWNFSGQVTAGIDLGPIPGVNLPNYYNETQESANVPYFFLGGNQTPNSRVGGGGAGCFASLIVSLASPYVMSIPQTAHDFFVTFNVSYHESSTTINISNIQYANQYPQAVLSSIQFNNEVHNFPGDSYMPVDGTYRPAHVSSQIFNGNNGVSVTIVVSTVLVGSDGGADLWPHPMSINILSLPEAENMLR